MTPTRIAPLSLDKIGREWSFYDCTDPRDPRRVGAVYKTKMEALADLGAYAQRAGWSENTMPAVKITIPTLRVTFDAKAFLEQISTRGAEIQTALYALITRDDLPAVVVVELLRLHSDLGTVVYDTMAAEIA